MLKSIFVASVALFVTAAAEAQREKRPGRGDAEAIVDNRSLSKAGLDEVEARTIEDSRGDDS